MEDGQAKRISVAVIDNRGEFAGLVPPHRMLAVLLAEHDEDVARFGVAVPIVGA